MLTGQALDVVKKLIKEGSVGHRPQRGSQTLKDWGYETSEFEALFPAPPPALVVAARPGPPPPIPHYQIVSARDAAYALDITGEEIKAVDWMGGGYGALPLPLGMEEAFVSLGWKLADSGDYQAAETIALFLRQKDHPIPANTVLEYMKATGQAPQPAPAPAEPEPNVFDTLTPEAEERRPRHHPEPAHQHGRGTGESGGHAICEHGRYRNCGGDALLHHLEESQGPRQGDSRQDQPGQGRIRNRRVNRAST